METGELFKNITQLPIISADLAEEMLAGNFRSIFKGQGMEFDEVRHYHLGDDIRSIDWNASARFGTPFVKMYKEEKELTIFFLLDISPSMHRNSFLRSENRQNRTPFEQALISMALIAFSAEHTDQRVGAFFYDINDRKIAIEKVFPPKKGRAHILKLIVTALQYQKDQNLRKKNEGSNLSLALQTAQRLLKKRSLVVIISDFYTINWERDLENLCRKHDCIAIRISDSNEVPYPGLITIEDPETGIKLEAPAGFPTFKENWTQWHIDRSTNWEAQCKRAGASFLELRCDSDAAPVLYKFFGSRKKQ